MDNPVRRKLILNYVALFLLLLFLVRLHQDFLYSERTYTKDISVADVFLNNKPYNIHLITYADGNEVHFRNQNTLAQSALNKGFDNIYLYNRKHLDEKFVEKNSHILMQSTGAGYWLWKPYLILKTLEKVAENDLVFYFDSGAKIVDEDMGSFLNKIDESDKDIFVFENNYNVRSYIKRDLLVHFDMDNSQYLDKKQALASVIIIRNTKASRAFIAEWLSLCETEQLITDKPSINEEYSDFIKHRHDQAILTLLAYKYPSLVYLFPTREHKELFQLHRRREDNKDKSLYIKNNPLLCIDTRNSNEIGFCSQWDEVF